MWLGLKRSEVSAVLGLSLTRYQCLVQNSWQWTDQWPVLFTNWGDSTEGNQTCAILDHYDDKWYPAGCEESHRAVCKWNTSPRPTTPPPGDCPGDQWQDIGGQACYYLDRVNEVMSWHEARSTCWMMTGPDGGKADLVSLHSQAEQDLLKERLLTETGQNVWLGLARGGDGTWSWVDESAFDFQFWADGEPNGSGEDGEDCVELYTVWDGKWNDAYCNDYKGILCMANKRIANNPLSPTQFVLPRTEDDICGQHDRRNH